MASKTHQEWMTPRQATERTCLSEATIRKLAREGRIGTLRIPGVPKTMFSRADVESLVSEGTRPATKTKRREMAEA